MSEPVGAASAPKHGRSLRRRLGTNAWLTGTITLAIVFAAWELAVRLFDVPPFILPAPSAIAQRAYADFSSGLIFVHFRVTLIEVVVGFALASLAGLILGTGIALVPFIERSIYPSILALQTVPKIAIAPLFIIWFGFGIQSKIIAVAMIAFFPVLVNVIVGMKTVDHERILLMQALKANAWQTFVKVRLPSMLPYLFAGLEVAIIFAVIGAVVGEFVGSSQGLGSLVIQRQSAVDVAGVFSALLYLSAMGVGLNLVLRLVTRRFAFWTSHPEPLSA